MNNMKIKLFNQTNQDTKTHKKFLKKLFRKVKDPLTMQIIFVNQQQIKDLNSQYRQLEHPTDVLSFVNDNPEDQTLGDVFISLEQASLQAKEFGHSYEREIGFLAVHGYLHLKGYDHHNQTDEQEMIAAQEAILRKAKLER